MKLDEYNIKARYFPTLIVLVPFSILLFHLFSPELISYFENNLFIQISSQLSTNVCLIFLIANIIRYIGKNLFEAKIYSNELEFPTTKYLLLSDNNLSNKYKNTIRKKAENDFNIKFPTLAIERDNPMVAKKEISEIVGLIRSKVGNGKLLLQHNIEYGFTRNLIAGSLLSIPVSVVNFFLINTNAMLIVNISVLLFFSFLLLFSVNVLNKLADLYAKRLFIEYLSS